MTPTVRTIRDLAMPNGEPAPYVAVRLSCGHGAVMARALLRTFLFHRLHECGECSFGRGV